MLSIGPGEQSRVYSTSDGCKTWKEDRRNEEKDGFWDGVVFSPNGKIGVLVGDPVGGRFHTDTFVNGRWTQDKLSCPAQPGDGAFSATLSIGVASYPDDSREKPEIIARADQALYSAKHGGRNRTVCFSDIDRKLKVAAAK